MEKWFTPETMKDEYHVALEREMERAMIVASTRERVRQARTKSPAAYIGLAVLAHDYGHDALMQGIRILMADKKEE